MLPPTRDERQLLLDAYLLEKAVYELSYELNNRPDWVRIPLQGIRHLWEAAQGSYLNCLHRATSRSAGGYTMSTDVWGIDDGYEDALGVWHPTPPTTRLALLAAMGVDPSAQSAPPAAPVQVVRPQHVTPLAGPAEVTLEDGTVLQIAATLPPDLPLGYHTLRPLDGGAAVQLIVSPGHCWGPRPPRQWGWAVQLYAMRSHQSWGIGDLADLRRLAHWSATAAGGPPLGQSVAGRPTGPPAATEPLFSQQPVLSQPVVPAH